LLAEVTLAWFGRLTLPNRPRLPSLHDGDDMVAATPKLPTSGYGLEVDGRLKVEFSTQAGARAGGEELKKRFPRLQVRIYDAETKAREEIRIP
jgi:hypothetical protein